jgi:mannitol operon repressor
MVDIPHDFKDALPRYRNIGPWLKALIEESDRGKVLISTGLIEEQLKTALLAFMRDVQSAAELFEGPAAPLGTFSSRVEMCFVLGLITDDEHHDLTFIQPIRDDFAHRIETTFETASVTGRCSELRLKAPGNRKLDVEGYGIAQEQFLNSITYLTLHLSLRAERVARHRCEERAWLY